MRGVWLGLDLGVTGVEEPGELVTMWTGDAQMVK